MTVFKKHLTPLTKGGTITKHAGKGSQSGRLQSAGNNLNPATTTTAQSMNDYAKATPMAQPTPPATDTGGGTDGLGSGNWPGIGQ